MMKGIIPKSKTTGVDICATDEYTYIIRSDLGCYMRTKDLENGSDLTVFSLHPFCRDGDHYIAMSDNWFNIIKGNSFRTVSDLSTDLHAIVGDIHPNCQGGDHYLHYFKVTSIVLNKMPRVVPCSSVIIIFQERGTFRITNNLIEDPKREFNLHTICSDGLYYWGLKDHFCCLKLVPGWGVDYYKGTHPDRDECVSAHSVHIDVVNFLPGGLSITRGPAFGRWEIIKTIRNDSDTTVMWQKKILKKVGYNKEKIKELTKNWKIGASATIGSGELAELIVKFQFSLSVEYGGSQVNTERESWDEATEVEEQLSFELEPHKSLYLWQYKLGLGGESVLFCRDLIIGNQPNPPAEGPLPPADA